MVKFNARSYHAKTNKNVKASSLREAKSRKAGGVRDAAIAKAKGAYESSKTKADGKKRSVMSMADRRYSERLRLSASKAQTQRVNRRKAADVSHGKTVARAGQTRDVRIAKARESFNRRTQSPGVTPS